MNREDIVKQAIQSLDLEISDLQVQQFIQYYEILVEWNSFMNLTGITEYEEVVIKHFVDSLLLVKAYDLSSVKSIMDLGTGAGFPGIPLKIMYPDIEFVLLDSLNKRIKFLNEVIKQLNLKKISAIHGRAEDYGRDKTYREKFDLCVSRAVANLSTLSEYCVPFVKKEGYFVPYKSGKIAEEVEAAKKAVLILGADIEKVVPLTLPNTDIERSFVIIHKEKETKKIYPRMAGKPSKEPLK
ncbi:16S rRNA (guanine(527)-N(7))-methyltransferase RsmG [Anaerosporobacter faecicola]|uniref:16S rRNA (guanine(527)-N(7))-methyltransferase RsmG n=1 Tax=Anaerosporobacter faecicola TaxID=2718714 RepID=UPI00143A073E|nr:16S rRNA (guanine(527)-N(7))-methyltransferase RsmG [Anaerosporobacter faecicola]